MKLENPGVILLDMPNGAALEVWDYNLGAAFVKVFLDEGQVVKLFKNQTVSPLGVEVFALDRLGYKPVPEPVPDDAYQIVADLLEHVRREIVAACDAWEVKKSEIRVSGNQRDTLEQIPVIGGVIEGLKRAADFIAAQTIALKATGREPGPFREATVDELIEKLKEKANYCRFEYDHTQDEADRRYYEGKEEAYNDLCNFLHRASKASPVAHFAPWGNFMQITRQMQTDFWNEVRDASLAEMKAVAAKEKQDKLNKEPKKSKPAKQPEAVEQANLFEDADADD